MVAQTTAVPITDLMNRTPVSMARDRSIQAIEERVLLVSPSAIQIRARRHQANASAPSPSPLRGSPGDGWAAYRWTLMDLNL
jgi:hypothetical protein